MSNILVCCLGNGIVFILHILFAALQHLSTVTTHRLQQPRIAIIKYNYIQHTNTDRCRGEYRLTSVYYSMNT